MDNTIIRISKSGINTSKMSLFPSSTFGAPCGQRCAGQLSITMNPEPGPGQGAAGAGRGGGRCNIYFLSAESAAAKCGNGRAEAEAARDRCRWSPVPRPARARLLEAGQSGGYRDGDLSPQSWQQ